MTGCDLGKRPRKLTEVGLKRLGINLFYLYKKKIEILKKWKVGMWLSRNEDLSISIFQLKAVDSKCLKFHVIIIKKVI